MPGSPLPNVTVNLEDRGWPYGTGGPPGAGWGDIPVTAAPKAVFDANSQPTTLLGGGLSSGYIKVTESILNINDQVKYPNQEIPNTGGERGWLFSFDARPLIKDNQGMELNYAIRSPMRRMWDYQRLYQPTNFYHRRFWKMNVEAESDIAGWEIGDEISARGSRGTFVGFDTETNGGALRAVIKPITSGQGPFIFQEGQVVTNVTKNTTFTSIGGGFAATNQKWMSAWVDDSDVNGGIHSGYANGGMFFGLLATDWTLPGDNGESNLYVTAQGNEFAGKPTTPNTYKNTFDNEKYYTSIFDPVDNGHFVNIVYERTRNTSENSKDAAYRVWKMVERSGSPYESWTLIWETTGADIWSPYQDNCFTHGYLFGNSNAGHDVQTDWYMNRWELWNQKPKFLTDAGV